MNLFKRYMIVDSPRPFELSTVRHGYTLTDELCYWQQPLWAVDSGLSRGWFVRELSTIPLGCRQQKNSLGLSTTKEFWANLNRLLNLFLIRIWSCWFLFLEELHACIKMGNCLLILYLVIDLFNKNSLSFCAEDVSKLPNLVKSCVLIFFFIYIFLVFGSYSRCITTLMLVIPTSDIYELSGFDGEFRSGGANQLGSSLQFRSEVKIW